MTKIELVEIGKGGWKDRDIETLSKVFPKLRELCVMDADQLTNAGLFHLGNIQALIFQNADSNSSAGSATFS